MRTTLTIDDDIVSKLQAEISVTGKSFKEVVNETLRLGLVFRVKLTDQQQAPFKVKSRPLGIKDGINYDNIGELLERIEGANYK